MEIRYPTHPRDASNYTSERLRKEYVLEELMQNGKINLVYTHHDRMIAGGIVPTSNELKLTTDSALKSDYFLQRREIGLINIGNTGVVKVDGEEYILENTDCLYIGKGSENVSFTSDNSSDPAKFYMISTPAHATYPTKKCSKKEAEIEELGSAEASNERSIYRCIHPNGIKSCQLVMGFTELKSGNVWNTMPAHTHARRSEIYFYFNLKEDQRVFHMMGEPENTRHLILSNEQGAISPAWSIHAGSGTGNYTFIWAMAGENQSFADMDFVAMDQLR